jgi:hypothetical protein
MRVIHKLAKKQFLVMCLFGATAHAASLAPNPYGPISYPGLPLRVTEAGVEAPGFEFNPRSVPKPQSWDAQWIWLPTNNPVAAGFRKEVTNG